MLRLHPTGYAQHERAPNTVRPEPFDKLGTGYAERSRRVNTGLYDISYLGSLYLCSCLYGKLLLAEVWRAALPFIPSPPFSTLFKSGLSSFLRQTPYQLGPGGLSSGNG